jgi:hypothetical protein
MLAIRRGFGALSERAYSHAFRPLTPTAGAQSSTRIMGKFDLALFIIIIFPWDQLSAFVILKCIDWLRDSASR